MTVSVIEQVDLSSGSATTLAPSIVATPVAGDFVLVNAASARASGGRTIASVSGMGATWAVSYQGSRHGFWIGSGATTAGAVTVTMSGGGALLVSVYLLRGLTATTAVGTQFVDSGASGTVTGSSSSAGVGQFVVSASVATTSVITAFPSTEVPSGWTTLATNSGQYGEYHRIPSAAATAHRCDTTLSATTGFANTLLVLGDESSAAIIVGTLAAEADSAPAGSVIAGALVAGTLATEADAANGGSLSLAEIIAGTLATETDAALGGASVANALIVGTQALEVDEALAAPVGPLTVVGGQAQETDTAQAGAIAATIVIGGLAQELSSGGYGSVRIMPPVTPAPIVAAQHSYVVAQAFGAVTMQGSQPIYSISQAATPRARQRIVVDGIDITYFRGGITPNIPYTLVEPLLYGPATMDVPQVAACFERVGYGELSFLRPGNEVTVQRVIDDVVVGTDYRGLVVAWDINGRKLSVELGGYGQGKAALRNRQVPIFARVNDIGRQIADSIRDLGLSHYPPLGAETGIEAMTMGGTGHLEHIQALVAKAWTRSGRQWTVMPDEVTGVYETHRKDDTTVHGTVFLDDARTVANLRRDIAEEPNRIYITCVLSNGQRVRFGVYPGLIQGPVPAFMGHIDEGDTGEAVRLLVGKLHATGYLKLVEAEGGYDADVTEAVKQLQDDAGLNQTGEVNEATWQALYDLGVTETSLEWANIQPAAQRRKVRPWNRSAQGGIMGINDDYDPSALVVDRNIDLGSGLKNRSQAREFARTALHDSDDPNWVGDITFHTGALIRGDGFEGMTVTPADVMDARELRPGMNLDLPQFDDGTFVHIAAIQVDDEGIVTATVDTRFRDAMEVWEVIARNKESRNDPTRSRSQQHRSSTITKDSIGEWDEFGGYLGNDVDLVEGWNTFEVIGAMEGTVRQLRIILDTPAEFACAVFGRQITADRLNNMIPRPLTNFGTQQWETKADELDERWVLVSEGTKDEPCGYSPGRKVVRVFDEGTDEETSSVVSPPTGKHVGASFPYRSYNRTELTVAVWVPAANKIPIQRILWPQLEAGV